MKVLIPFSGGINSTYALWKWLSETDAEVYARFATEGYLSAGRRSSDEKAADKIALRLQNTVRSFDYEKTNWPVPYEANHLPIRSGFSNTVDYGICAPRYLGYAQMSAALGVDAIVLGISLENTATDIHPTYKSVIERPDLSIYHAGSAEWDVPVPRGEAFNYETEAPKMIGRFEQLAALPADIASLIEGCPEKHKLSKVSPLCNSCLYRAVSETDVGLTPREIDQYFAQQGHYGVWRSEADPATYVWRNRPYDAAVRLLGHTLDNLPDAP